MRKVLLSIIIVIALLAGGLFMYLRHNMDKVLKEQLIFAFNETFRGKYIFHAGKLKTNLFSGNATLEDITFRSVQSPGNPLLKADIHSIKLSGLNILKYFRNKDLQFHSIEINNPDLFYREAANPDDKTGNNLLKIIPEFLTGLTNSVNISTFGITDGKVLYITNSGKSTIVNSGDNFNFRISGISVIHKPSPALVADNSEFSVENLCISRDHKKEFGLRKLSGNSKDSTVAAEGISFERFRYQGYVFSGGVKKLSSAGFDIPETFASYHLKGRNVEISDGTLEIKSSPLPADTHKSSGLKPVYFAFNNLDVKNLKVNADLQSGNNTSKYYEGKLNLTFTDLNNLKKGRSDIRDLKFEIKDFQMKTASNDRLSVKRINGSKSKEEVKISGLSYNRKLNKDKTGVVLSLPEVQASGVHFNKTGSPAVNSTRLLINQPSLRLSFFEKNGSAPAPGINDLIKDLGNDYLGTAEINILEIRNGKLEVAINSGHEKKYHNFDKVNITSRNLQLARNSRDKPIDPAQLKVQVGKYNLLCPDFQVQAENLAADGNNAVLSCENINITQLHHGIKDPALFYDGKVRNLKVTGVNFHDLLNDNEISAGQLQIHGGELLIDNNEEKSRNNDDGRAPGTKELLLLIPFQFQFNRIDISKSRVEFINQPEGRYHAARLLFENLNVNTDYISNNPGFLNTTRISLSSRLQGKANFVSELSLPLMKDKLSCVYKGSLGKMEGTEFNDWLAISDIGIKRGTIDNLNFQINLKENQASGKMALLYTDLRLNVYNSKTGKKKKLASFLSRLFVNRNNNARKGHPAKAVRIQSDVPADNLFYSLWLPLKDGMIKTIRNDFSLPGIE